VTLDFDRLLRDTVHELAAEGRPVDLTGPALRTARRIRTQRAVAAVASALVLVVGIGVAAVRIGGTDRSAPPAERSPSPVTSSAAQAPTETESLPPGSAPVSLPGGWLIRAAPAPLGAVIYDDRLGRYRLMAVGNRVAPSPNGQFVAQVTRNGEVVLSRAADDKEIRRRTTTALGDTGYPVWAPDSSRVAFVSFTPEGDRLVLMNVDGTERLSADLVPCSGGCTVKWLSNSRSVRLYTASNKVEVTAATGEVGPLSATPEDPCGHQRIGYQIDNQTWLCVTPNGFAVTAPDGTVTQRVPFPTSIDGFAVEGSINGYALFRPK
jgi:hypothetical protein